MLDNFPAELRALPQWVVHKAKRPYNPRTGADASAGKPDTWADFESARRALSKGYDGLGFEFHNTGIVGIDLDTVRDPETGWVAPEAQEIIEKVASYTELSPSGYGYHILARADIDLERNKRGLPANQIMRPDVDLRTGEARCNPDGSVKYKKPEIEIYKEGRYFTVTGAALDGYRDMQDRTAAVQDVYEQWVAQVDASRPAASREPEELVFVGDFLKRGLERDQKLKALWDGDRPNGNESADDQALMNKLAYWCNCNAEAMIGAFMQSPHAQQKDAAHAKKAQRTDYLQRTAQTAIKDCNRTAEADHRRYLDQRRVHAVQDFAKATAPHEDRPPSNAVINSADDLIAYSLDDIGAAKLFADMYRGRVLYLPEYKGYFAYANGRWEQDKQDLMTRRLAKALSDLVTKLIPPEPLSNGDEKPDDPWKFYRKHYQKYRGMKYRETQLRDARDNLFGSASDFDKQPFYFNCLNGTLDLKTGKLHPHTPEDKLSKRANVRYDPDARCERWVSFVDEITEGRKDRARMLQKALGYALQGEANEECYFTAIGEQTRNGKGTMFDTIMNIFGSYGAQIDFNTLARAGSRDGSRPTPDIARLVGVRLALSNEPQKGICVNEALLKQLTGNDDIVGRPLYGDILQFKPVFKLFVTANSKPTIADDSLFSSGRVKLLPFTRFFSEEERDVHLKEYFRSEEAKSGILNWLLEGYALYQSEGLRDTDEMKTLTDEYRLENDYIQQFLDECVDLNASGTIQLKQLRMNYATWCTQVGTTALGLKLFKEELRKHGVEIRGIHNNVLGVDGRFTSEAPYL